MTEPVSQGELFRDLSGEGVQRILAIGKGQTLGTGQYLFLLGDQAEALYVVRSGKLELCLPIPLHGQAKDIVVESVGVGQALGWSALVKPYRFTMSARASEPSEVVGFARDDLQQLFAAEPGLGISVLTRVSEIVGIRLITFQMLWARELQRAVEAEAQRSTEAR